MFNIAIQYTEKLKPLNKDNSLIRMRALSNLLNGEITHQKLIDIIIAS